MFPTRGVGRVCLFLSLLKLAESFVVPLNYASYDSFNGISNPTGLIAPLSTAIQLVPDANDLVSAYWYLNQLDISGGFITTYTWSWAENKRAGNGVAFVLQNNPEGENFIGPNGCNWGFRANSPPNPYSFGIGFDGNADSKSMRYIFAVTGDSNNPGCLDPNDPSQWTAVARFAASLAPNPDSFNVTISWDAQTNILSTFYSDEFGVFARFSVEVDIIEVIGSNLAWVGFTASTGNASAAFQIKGMWNWTAPWSSPVTVAPTSPVTMRPPTTVPVTTTPVTTIPVTTTPVTTMPVTTVPVTTVPLTTLPLTTLPQTTVPETTVPLTTLPLTTTPVTTLPPTTLPPTTLPQPTTSTPQPTPNPTFNPTPTPTVLPTTVLPLLTYGDACTNLSLGNFPGVFLNCTEGRSIIIVTQALTVHGNFYLSNSSTLILYEPITLAGYLNASGILIANMAPSSGSSLAIASPYVNSLFSQVSTNEECYSRVFQNYTESGIYISYIVKPDCLDPRLPTSTLLSIILGTFSGVFLVFLVYVTWRFYNYHSNPPIDDTSDEDI